MVVVLYIIVNYYIPHSFHAALVRGGSHRVVGSPVAREQVPEILVSCCNVN